MKLRNSFQIQKSVFYALFIRELKTRFGGIRLGIFWALAEPISHILVLTTLFSFVASRNDLYGVPFALFFSAGILSFFIFQKIVTISVSSIKSNMGLFTYRQVKPFDAVIVRSIIELLIIISVMILLTWLGIWVFGYECLPNDPLRVGLVIILLFILTLGISFFTSVMGVKYQESGQLVTMSIRPLYFISGVLFPLDSMPNEFHIYLLWNPILHAVEEFRAAWFVDYTTESTSLIFLFMWALPTLFLGLAYYHNNRTAVLMQ